jgi:hypothetical protein
MSFNNKENIKSASGRNGYEIRTDILDMATNLVQFEHTTKMDIWNQTVQREDNGRILDTGNIPLFSGIEQVLETAERLYSFVNNSK